MGENVTMQDRILLELYLKGREVSTADIMRLTKLKQFQVYRACRRLHERGLIVKRYDERPAKRQSPPNKDLFIKIKDHEFSRKVLSKKGLV